MSAPDESWAEFARASREALALLGRPTEPECLPDEAEPCGGSFGLHAMANLATIKAICDHQLDHLGATPGQIYEVYAAGLAEMAERCQGVNP